MKKRVPAAAAALAAMLIAVPASVQAQAPAAPAPKAAPKDPLDRESPQSAILAFLDACREKNYARAARYLDLSKLSAQERVTQGPQLAQELADLLESDPQFDVAAVSAEPNGETADGLPSDRDRVASFDINGKMMDIQIARKNLRSGLSIWRFADDTVQQIPELVRLQSSSPIERILPAPLVLWKFVDTPLWRWIALLLAAMVLSAISRWVARLAIFLLNAILGRAVPQVKWNELNFFVGPFRLLLSVALFRATMEVINPSALVRLYLGRVLDFLFIFGVAWVCMRIVDSASTRARRRLDTKQQTVTRAVLPLISRVVKIAIFIFGATAVLNAWGFKVSTILAGVGIGGIAVALAAQKTMENLFGGVSVIGDRPVYVGDYCKFGDSSGVVEDIGLRSTRIRTADRTLMVVPNSQFSTVTLENFSRRDKMLFDPVFNLRKESTPGQIRSALEGVRKALEGNPKVELGECPVRFTGLSTTSLDVQVYVYILTVDGNEFVKIRQELLLKILDAIAAAGTALA